MKKTTLPLLLVLLLTSLACSLFTGPVASNDSPAENAPAANNNTLFQDDFSNPNSGWDRADWDEGLTDYGDGVYKMYVKTSSFDIWANPGKSFDGDVRVEADATKVGGEDDNDYGVICRYSGSPESPNYYFGIISSDGYAVVGKVAAGSTEYISNENMVPSDAIKQGAATNRIRLDCIGSNLTLFVNGQQVETATDSSFTSGDVGLLAGTFEVSSTEIHFDNFLVSKP
ncbi:MAG: hypothetical protein GY755_08915 [Chloroflexi bacterium]|nr:hypothetical protein [Chloroflexota bacterium]